MLDAEDSPEHDIRNQLYWQQYRGFKSHPLRHVRRSLIHSVSTVCVSAVKTPYSQAPSSSSNRIHKGFDLIFMSVFSSELLSLLLSNSKQCFVVGVGDGGGRRSDFFK